MPFAASDGPTLRRRLRSPRRIVEVGTEMALADALCGTFHARSGIPPDLLSDDDITTILKKLETVTALPGPPGPRVSGDGIGTPAS